MSFQRAIGAPSLLVSCALVAFGCGVSDRKLNLAATGGGGGAGGQAGSSGSGGGAAGDGGPAHCSSSSDCSGGPCLPSGDCGAPPLTLSGHVQRYEVLNTSYQAGVTVAATDLLPNVTAPASPADGSYTLADLPRGAFMNLELAWDTETSTVPIPAPLRRTRVATSSAGTEPSRSLDLPFVSFDWLAQVAVDCGIFPDAATAKGSGAINPFWIQRSTMLVEVRDGSGNPLSGIGTDQIEVVLGARSNKHLDPGDTDNYPARVCFLKAAAGGATLQGSTQTATDGTGRFVMFRVQNDTNGTGFGIATVRVSGIPAQVVTLRSSGQIGVVQVGGGLGFTAQPSRARNFETDVYPIFTTGACVGCHAPLVSSADGGADVPGPGYDKSTPRGPDQLKADYSGTPDEVYAVLTATNGGDCSSADKLERICTNDPAHSLLTHMPLVDPPMQEDHPTALFYTTDDPDYQSLFEWIEQGAKRR